MDSDTLLDVSDLSLTLAGQPDPLWSDLRFQLPAGGSLGLGGASGVGKSMIARVLLGLEPAAATVAGRVQFQSQELLGRPAGRTGIGWIGQHPRSALDPLRRVGSQVASLARRHQQLDRRSAQQRALALLAEVGLPADLARSYPHELSGGQCQRVAIALALACQPRLLIADEPTSSLDAVAQAGVLDLLCQLPERHALGLLLISHDPAALARCEESFLLEAGQMVPMPAAPARHGAPSSSAPPQEGIAPRLAARGVSVTLRSRQGVWRSRAVPILHSVDLDLLPGQTVALVGASGSGKTTLARALTGLLPLAGGTVQLDGESVAGLERTDRLVLRRQVQIVFQDPDTTLNPRRTIAQALAEPLALHQIQDRSVSDLLAQVELPESLRHRYPHQISGGQRQRVAIARALAPGPGVLICDEPVSALDAALRDRLLALLQRIRDQHDLAILLIAHDLALVARVADRVAVMDRGRIVEQGLTDAVLQQPQSPITQGLLEAAAGQPLECA